MTFAFDYLANPARFKRLAAWLRPLCGWLALALLPVGLLGALVLAPPDYQQGDSARIMYVHVPSAWLALALYAAMAVAALCSLVWRHPLADLFCRAAAPVGATFTALCLITGSIWGLPMWGTWWVWDARLTSVLILFLLYLGYMALLDAFAQPQRGEKAGALLLLLGVVNLPIIKYSVEWWYTLHQGSSINLVGRDAVHISMAWPLHIMGLAFAALAGWLVLLRLLAEISKRAHYLRELAA